MTNRTTALLLFPALVFVIFSALLLTPPPAHAVIIPASSITSAPFVSSVLDVSDVELNGANVTATLTPPDNVDEAGALLTSSELAFAITIDDISADISSFCFDIDFSAPGDVTAHALTSSAIASGGMADYSFDAITNTFSLPLIPAGDPVTLYGYVTFTPADPYPDQLTMTITAPGGATDTWTRYISSDYTPPAPATTDDDDTPPAPDDDFSDLSIPLSAYINGLTNDPLSALETSFIPGTAYNFTFQIDLKNISAPIPALRFYFLISGPGEVRAHTLSVLHGLWTTPAYTFDPGTGCFIVSNIPEGASTIAGSVNYYIPPDPTDYIQISARLVTPQDRIPGDDTWAHPITYPASPDTDTPTEDQDPTTPDPAPQVSLTIAPYTPGRLLSSVRGGEYPYFGQFKITLTNTGNTDLNGYTINYDYTGAGDYKVTGPDTIDPGAKTITINDCFPPDHTRTYTGTAYITPEDEPPAVRVSALPSVWSYGLDDYDTAEPGVVTATVSGDYDTDTTDNFADYLIAVPREYLNVNYASTYEDFSLLKEERVNGGPWTTDPTPARPGDTVDYRLTVTYTPSDHIDPTRPTLATVYVEDVLPAPLELIPGSEIISDYVDALPETDEEKQYMEDFISEYGGKEIFAVPFETVPMTAPETWGDDNTDYDGACDIPAPVTWGPGTCIRIVLAHDTLMSDDWTASATFSALIPDDTAPGDYTNYFALIDKGPRIFSNPATITIDQPPAGVIPAYPTPQPAPAQVIPDTPTPQPDAPTVYTSAVRSDTIPAPRYVETPARTSETKTILHTLDPARPYIPAGAFALFALLVFFIRRRAL